MQNLTVRAATATDLPQLAQLWYDKMALHQQVSKHVRLAPDAGSRWQSEAAMWLQDNQTAFFVAQAAEKETEPVGYIVVKITPSLPGTLPEQIGDIRDIALDLHNYHGGLGRQLFRAAQAWLSERGVQHVVASTPTYSAVEQAFWRSLGMTEWTNTLWMKF